MTARIGHRAPASLVRGAGGPQPDEQRPGPLRPRAAIARPRWRAYLELTKPRIIRLLLVTTVPSMLLAASGWPGIQLVAATVIGGALAAGSASAFNMVLDRDLDQKMERTRTRPLVTGEITVPSAVIFAALLGAVSLGWLWAFVNLFAAALTALAIALYVVFYTLILKRRTDQNIVWGGVAGCMPVLIGWVAVTEQLALAPFVLFLVVFLWTPAHYWPLALAYRDDYRDAGVPMLPVTTGTPVVARRSLLYAAATVAAAVALTPIGGLGAIYLTATGVAGAWFLARAIRLLAAPTTGRAMSTFHASILFLAVVFAALAVDCLL